MQCSFRTTFFSTSFLCGINGQCSTISFVMSTSNPFLLVAVFLTTISSLEVTVFDIPPSQPPFVRPSVRPSCRRSLAFVSRYLKPRSQGLFFPSPPVPEDPGEEFVHPPSLVLECVGRLQPFLGTSYRILT